MPDELWKRKKRRKQPDELTTPKPLEAEVEPELTGFVNQLEASSHEERFARALRAANIQFTFKKLIYTPFQIPGQNYEVDFIVFEGIPQPIEIDDEWIHRTQDEQSQDNLRDTLISDIIERMGYARVKRIKVDMNWDQEMFHNLVDTLF